MLTSKQRAALRALAHDRKPVVLIGHKGLTGAVATETAAALLAHELIKVRMGEGEGLEADAQSLATDVEAELVALIGRVAILFKQHPDADKRRVQLPKEKKKRLFDVKEG